VYLATAVAAAAAILAVVLLPPYFRDAQPVNEPVRAAAPAGQPGGAPGIAIIAPTERATVEPASVAFAWRPQGSRTTYHLTLSDESGAVLWTTETTDTTAVLPNTVPLARNRTYYWYVDALQADGRSVSSGVHHLCTAQ
jgi:hypothetical protein